MKTPQNTDDNRRELDRYKHIIGKKNHDAWVDTHVRNLSVDVVNEMEKTRRLSSQRFVLVVPIAVAFTLLLLLIIKPSFNSVDQSTHSETAYSFVPSSEIEEALLAEITDDEAVEMIIVEAELKPIILTDSDIDNLLKEL